MARRTVLLLIGLVVVAASAAMVFVGVHAALNPTFAIQVTPLSNGRAAGPSRIIDVEAPGADVGSHALVGRVLSPSGEFTIVGNGSHALLPGASVAGYPDLASGKDLDVHSVTIGTDALGRSAVNFSVHDPAATLIANYTSSRVGGYMAVAIGGKVVVDLLIQDALSNGTLQISPGSGSLEEATGMVIALKVGTSSSPMRLQVISAPSPISAWGWPIALLAAVVCLVVGVVTYRYYRASRIMPGLESQREH